MRRKLPDREKALKSETRKRRRAALCHKQPHPNRPMFVVGGVASFVVLLTLFAAPLARLFVPRINPRISFETDGAGSSSSAERGVPQGGAKQAALFDNEVSRTEARLRETAVVAIAAYTAALHGFTRKNVPPTVEALVASIDRRPLSSIGLEVTPDNTGFISAHNTLYVRYRPQTLEVEILAKPRTLRDGAALLMRLPETDASDLPPNRLRYFEAMRLDGVSIPPPFSLSPAIQAAGWRSQLMDAQLPPNVAPEQLMDWLRQHAGEESAHNTTPQ